MKSPLKFDVIMHGTVQEGKDINEAQIKMANLFDTDVSKIRNRFKKGKSSLLTGLSNEQAQKVCHELSNIGINCSLKESKPELSLVPIIEEVKPEKIEKICPWPDCGYEEDPKARKIKDICSECGRSSSKFSAVYGELEKRKEVRQRLIKEQESAIERNTEEQQRKEKVKSEKKIEKEEKKKLGIKNNLIVVGTIGVIMVVSIVLLTLFNRGNDAFSLEKNNFDIPESMAGLTSEEAVGKIDNMFGEEGVDGKLFNSEGIDSLYSDEKGVDGTLSKLKGIDSLYRDEGGENIDEKSLEVTRTGKNNETVISSYLSAKEEDAWEVILLGSVRNLSNKVKIHEAIKTSTFIQNAVLKVEALTIISRYMFESKMNAEKIIKQAYINTKKVKNTPDLVKSLGLIAVSLSKTGQQKRADKTLIVAKDFIEKNNNAYDRAISYNYLAVFNAKTGYVQIADEYFRRAMDETKKISNSLKQTKAIVTIADGQREIGKNSIVTKLLNIARKKIPALTHEEQDYVLKAIAIVSVKNGAFQTAVKETGNISNSIVFDEASYSIGLVALLGKQFSSAKVIMAKINSQQLRAIAYMMLSRSDITSKDEYYNKAKHQVSEITDPSTRVVAWSIVAKHRARSGEIKEAKELFDKAFDLASSINKSNTSYVLATLSINEARTGLSSRADKTLEKIQDNKFKKKVQQHIKTISSNVEYLNSIGVDINKLASSPLKEVILRENIFSENI
jgi:tetratricopeptide (TPR) repeat protein